MDESFCNLGIQTNILMNLIGEFIIDGDAALRERLERCIQNPLNQLVHIVHTFVIALLEKQIRNLAFWNEAYDLPHQPYSRPLKFLILKRLQ